MLFKVQIWNSLLAPPHYFLLFFFLFIVFSEGEFGLSLQEFVSMNTMICLVRQIGYSCFACCYALFAYYFLLACSWYLHHHIIACVVYDFALVDWASFVNSWQKGGESCFSCVLGFHVFMSCVFIYSCYMFLNVFHLMLQDNLAICLLPFHILLWD